MKPEVLPVPRCPHCSQEMAAVNYFNWAADPWIVLAIYCPDPDCHKVLNMQILPGAGMIVQQPDKTHLV